MPLMSEAPKVIKFPPRPKQDEPLVLPRRRLRSPFEVSDTTAEAQKTISALRSATRNPWGEILNTLNDGKLPELEKSLRQLSAKLDEKERFLQDLEAKMHERQRELAEMETLLQARESLFEAGKNNAGPAAQPLTTAEKDALEKLKAEIERQEASLQEQRQALKEREAFLDESETRLFEKVQEQQEKETELEQLEEELKRRERRLREREAQHDPKLAEALAAEKAAAKKYDEFQE